MKIELKPHIIEARDYLLGYNPKKAYEIVQKHEDMSYLFAHIDNVAPEIPDDIQQWDVSMIKNMQGLFYNRTDLEIIDLSKWDTSNVRDMSYMFYKCKQASILVDNLNVSNVINASHMFYKCWSFNADLSRWDVSNLVDASYMFYECFHLGMSSEVITLPEWFKYHNVLYKEPLWLLSSIKKETCNKKIATYSYFLPNRYVTCDLSQWNTQNLSNTSHMFYRCVSLDANLSSWNVEKLKDASNMFEDCFYFCSDLSKWNTKNLSNASYMFFNCILFDSDLSQWDVSNLSNARFMFANCWQLRGNFTYWRLSLCCVDVYGMFFNCPNVYINVRQFIKNNPHLAYKKIFFENKNVYMKNNFRDYYLHSFYKSDLIKCDHELFNFFLARKIDDVYRYGGIRLLCPYVDLDDDELPPSPIYESLGEIFSSIDVKSIDNFYSIINSAYCASIIIQLCPPGKRRSFHLFYKLSALAKKGYIHSKRKEDKGDIQQNQEVIRKYHRKRKTNVNLLNVIFFLIFCGFIFMLVYYLILQKFVFIQKIVLFVLKLILYTGMIGIPILFIVSILYHSCPAARKNINKFDDWLNNNGIPYIKNVVVPKIKESIKMLQQWLKNQVIPYVQNVIIPKTVELTKMFQQWLKNQVIPYIKNVIMPKIKEYTKTFYKLLKTKAVPYIQNVVIPNTKKYTKMLYKELKNKPIQYIQNVIIPKTKKYIKIPYQWLRNKGIPYTKNVIIPRIQELTKMFCQWLKKIVLHTQT